MGSDLGVSGFCKACRATLISKSVTWGGVLMPLAEVVSRFVYLNDVTGVADVVDRDECLRSGYFPRGLLTAMLFCWYRGCVGGLVSKRAELGVRGVLLAKEEGVLTGGTSGGADMRGGGRGVKPSPFWYAFKSRLMVSFSEIKRMKAKIHNTSYN